MKLFLIGLLGSGKSFLGKEISERAKLPFIDLDEVIEEQAGMKISEIFSTRGEDYFRKIEASTLREQSAQKEFVMATGGGAPCFHDNMTFINETGISLFLTTPIPEIIKRLKGEERTTRPLLSNVPDDQLQPTLEAMLQNRMPFYKKAQIQVNGATVSVDEILNLLNVKR